ncbi:MAG: AgmX/PglI C-terminal domain-containing protein [Myxococcaceae bacterium]
MAEKGPKKQPLQDVPEDEIGSALDEAMVANTRPSPGSAPKEAPVPAPAPPAPPPPAVPVDPSTQWFLGIDDRQEGPFSIDQIREMVASGKATKDTLCWKPGLSDWLEIAHTPDLASLVAVKAAPAPEPAPYMAPTPAVSLSSLAQGELNVLARPREEPTRERPAAPKRASLLESLEPPEPHQPNERIGAPEPPEPDEPNDAPQTYRPRPPAPSSPTWADQPRRGVTTYLMAGGGLVILLLAAAVVFLVVRTPSAPIAPQEPVVVDAGAAVVVAPPIDAGPAAVPDAGEAVPEEPPLSPEELAKLPESLKSKDIMGVVVADREALTGCVDAQQEADPDVSGKLVMRWTILPSGKTSGVEVISKQFEGSTMAGCVSERIKGWRFPRHRKQGTPIDFPFKF